MSLIRSSRKKLRIDGTARGIKYSYRIPRVTQPDDTGHKAQFVPMTGYAFTSLPDDYDPADRAYILDRPHYRPDDPWHSAPPFAEPLAQPPSMFPGSELGPSEPHFDDGFASGLDPMSIDETPSHEVDIGTLFDAGRVPTMKIGEIHDHMAMMRDYADSVFAGDMIDAATENYFLEPSANQLWSESMNQAIDGLQEMADLMQEMDMPMDDPAQASVAVAPEMIDWIGQSPTDGWIDPQDQLAMQFQLDPTNQPLEDIIHGAMQQMDPFSMPDPFGLPPGLGPMGPM